MKGETEPYDGATLSAVFFALSDETRLKVVELISAEPLRVSELAERLGASRPGMSRHLRILREAGLVEKQESDDRRVRVVALQRLALEQIREWLDARDQFWSAQLASFKQVAERKGRKATRASRRVS